MKPVILLMLALVVASAAAAQGQTLIASYHAYIGKEDLVNSNGQRLTQPWQILRQDRANYHRFGIAHPGDDWDGFFGTAQNRAIMERMMQNGRIDPVAARAVTQGGAKVRVDIYGRNGQGEALQIYVDR
ncbi:hypothetical protein [Roseinatronobacter sp. NSM]|uniref:hypothetical protein n=1 Tax=Roseinatronobacter sp. NSM TaxID=3457785 RepID=UPI004036C60D